MHANLYLFCHIHIVRYKKTITNTVTILWCIKEFENLFYVFHIFYVSAKKCKAYIRQSECI